MKVELLKEKGDKLILNAARASFDRTWDEFSPEQNQRLLNFLARAKPAHFVPYTHSRHTFLCRRNDIKWAKLTMNHWAGIEIEYQEDKVLITNSLWGWKELIDQKLLTGHFSSYVSNFFSIMPDIGGSALALGFRAHTIKEDTYLRYMGEGLRYTMRITCPIAIARQFVKTSVGVSISEASGRYILYTSKAKPTKWLSAPANRKQGSGNPLGFVKQKLADALLSLGYTTATAIYRTLMALNVAPEQARFVMPLGANTTFVVTFTRPALERFFELRLEETAQTEIRELAQMMKNVTNL